VKWGNYEQSEYGEHKNPLISRVMLDEESRGGWGRVKLSELGNIRQAARFTMKEVHKNGTPTPGRSNQGIQRNSDLHGGKLPAGGITSLDGLFRIVP